MKIYWVILCIMFCTLAAQAQNYDIAVADIDLDGVSDTLHIDREAGVLVCRLSRLNFKPLKSRPMEALTSGDYEFVGLTALPGTFQLLYLTDNSSSYFSFVYDEKRKKVYLDEHWSESPGNDIGIGAYEFSHNLRRSCVYYWIRYYKGATDPDTYDPNAFYTEKVDKRVRKSRVRFEKFSDKKYYQKTAYIWKDTPLHSLVIYRISK